MQDLLAVALRIVFMYLYALALVRLSGKRSLGSLSSLDFVATLILGDMFDDVIWGQIPVANGITAMGTIILVHGLMSFAGYSLPAFDRWVLGSQKTTVVSNGRWADDSLRRARLSKDEAWAHLRLLGEDKLGEIEAANIEPSGHFAALKKEFAKTVQKIDIPALKERF